MVAYQVTDSVIPDLAVIVGPGLVLQSWLMNISHRGRKLEWESAQSNCTFIPVDSAKHSQDIGLVKVEEEVFEGVVLHIRHLW